MRNKAVPIVAVREHLADGIFYQIVVWQVPVPVRGSRHRYKYSLALVAGDSCVLRYDNEAGKGDHKHVGDDEQPYAFRGIEQLQRDFFLDAGRWLAENGGDRGPPA